jgi:hypothetical protein
MHLDMSPLAFMRPLAALAALAALVPRPRRHLIRLVSAQLRFEN